MSKTSRRARAANRAYFVSPMARYQEPNEVRADHIKAFGKELGLVFHQLYNDVNWLHVRWQQYHLLYGTNPERIDLLNQSGSLFFRLLQDTLFEQTLLDISRLTDPPEQNGHQNLSLLRLVDALPDGELKKATQGRLKTVLKAAAFARDWRNRRIAHRDLDVALQRGAGQLKQASRLRVEKALAAIASLLNGVSVHYLDSETVFGGLGLWGDATHLLYVLRDGLRAQREKLGRMQAGQYEQGDFEPGGPI